MSFSLPVHNLSLVGSVVTTSYVLFSNIANAQMGIVPLLNGKLGSFQTTAEGKVQGWNAFFPIGMRWGIAPSITSALLSFTTAYLHPHKRIRRLALYSGIASLLIGPITFGLGLPAINSQLLAMGAESAKGTGDFQASGRGLLVDKLIKDWEGKHNVRFASYVGGWAFSMAALVLAL